MRFAQEISIFNPHAIEMAVVALGTQITQTAEEIRLEAAQTLSNYSTTVQMNAAISTKANEITSEVSQTYATQSGVNTSVNSLSSRIQQTATEISFTLSKSGDRTAQLAMTYTKENGSTVRLAAQSIEFTGLVRFTDLSTSGSTTINGSNITTGTIKDANSNTTFNLSTGLLTIKKGSINLGSGKFTVTDAGAMTAISGSVGGWTLATKRLSSGSGTTYVGLDSNTSNTYAIWAGNATASSAPFRVTRAGKLYAKDIEVSGTVSGATISGANIGGSTIVVGDGGNNTCKLYINGSTGNVWAGNLNIMTTDGFPIGGFYQDGDTEGNATSSGHWMRLWTGHGLKISGELGEWFKCATYAVFTTHTYFRAEVFNANGDVQFYSDRKAKQDIVPLDMQKSVDTIMALKPVRYRYKTSPDVVRHGFIAQDVQSAVSDDWGVVGECVDHTTKEKTLTLKYTELIADLVATAQAQDKRIKALEAQHG